MKKVSKAEAFLGKVGRFLRLTSSPSTRDLAVESFALKHNGDFGRDPDALDHGFRAQILKEDWLIRVNGWATSAGRGVPIEGVEFCTVAPSTSKLRFVVQKSTLADRVKDLVGVKDLQLGVPELDSALHIEGTHTDAVRSLLMNGNLAETLRTLPGDFSLYLVSNAHARHEIDAGHLELQLAYTGEVSSQMTELYYQAFVSVLKALQADGQIG